MRWSVSQTTSMNFHKISSVSNTNQQVNLFLIYVAVMVMTVKVCFGDDSDVVDVAGDGSGCGLANPFPLKGLSTGDF